MSNSDKGQSEGGGKGGSADIDTKARVGIYHVSLASQNISTNTLNINNLPIYNVIGEGCSKPHHIEAKFSESTQRQPTHNWEERKVYQEP